MLGGTQRATPRCLASRLCYSTQQSLRRGRKAFTAEGPAAWLVRQFGKRVAIRETFETWLCDLISSSARSPLPAAMAS
ncbi:hypothetical protein QF026_000684 [Streptomyces aurantiacus]|nr:hypothetical protein [Streptomyces aurantiacus]